MGRFYIRNIKFISLFNKSINVFIDLFIQFIFINTFNLFFIILRRAHDVMRTGYYIELISH